MNMILKFSPMLFAIGVLPAADVSQKPLLVDIQNAAGQIVGTAKLAEGKPRGVELTLDIWNLPPGKHAFHIHQKPECDAKKDFNTAGLQFDPTQGTHTTEGPAGNPHAEVAVAADGTGHLTVVLSNLTLGEDSHSVLPNGGRAIVFHSAAGASGPTRIACGIIRRPK